MTSDPASADAAATPPSIPAQEEAATTTATTTDQHPPSKIDPITAVQDSIDSLALSLFEALRGVRDAVAPESLEVPGARPAAASTTTTAATSAFGEASEEMEKDATAKERLLNGVNPEYFPPLAFDLLEPDYDAFIMTYLSDNPYAKDLVDRFAALESKAYDLKQPASTASSSVIDAKEAAANSTEVRLGDVGYEFRKRFDAGWYTGKVIEIRPLAANGYSRRCVYSDGDMEDLKLEDLEQLAVLDSGNKKRKLSAKPSQSDHPKGGGNKIDVKFPLTKAEYTKLLLDSEHHRDVQTTKLLAQDILAKSAAVDDLVAKLPGMNRTRQMQMDRINELIETNHEVTRELEEAYVVAKDRREEVRATLGESTCLALGVEEDT